MCSVHVDGLVERERYVVPIERRVGRRVKARQRRVRQAGQELLDVADALRRAHWVPRAARVPKLEVCRGGQTRRGCHKHPAHRPRTGSPSTPPP